MTTQSSKSTAVRRRRRPPLVAIAALVLLAAAIALWTRLGRRRPPIPAATALRPHSSARETVPAAAPQPAPAPAPAPARVSPWVIPVEGQCPESHPIKANANSSIYHVPGGQSYNRTKPERCYCDGETAEADGFRAAKR